MRYYDLKLFAPGSTQPVREWTSHPGGVFDPGALDIELDVGIAPYATPYGASTIIVHGVSLADLQQANSWGMDGESPQGYTVQLYGGMQAGLPLANPKQAKLLFAGSVFQAFGNWEGTEMHIVFVVSASGFSPSLPGNFVLNWQAGQPLSQAMANCMKVAYPTLPQEIHISSSLVLNYTQVHPAHTLESLAGWVNAFTSQHFNNPVSIYLQAGVVFVLDNTYSPTPKQIVFTDLMGQPTWIGVKTLQMKFVMRGDLNVGDLIEMPQALQSPQGLAVPGIVLSQQSSYPSSIKYRTTFNGTFRVTSIRQVGHYRQPDGAAWATIVNGVING